MVSSIVFPVDAVILVGSLEVLAITLEALHDTTKRSPKTLCFWQ